MRPHPCPLAYRPPQGEGNQKARNSLHRANLNRASVLGPHKYVTMIAAIAVIAAVIAGM